MKKFLSIVILSSIAFNVIGQQEQSKILTDRPDQTESAQIVPTGKLQLETGFMFENDMKINRYSYNSSLLRYGANANLELRVIAEYNGESFKSIDGKQKESRGFSPLSVGTKIKIAKARGFVPETAFLGHIVLKTGAKEFRPDYVAGNFRFSMEYDLSKIFSLGINLGGQWDGYVPNATGIYTIVLGSAISNKLALFSEAYGFIPEEQGQADHRFNIGFTYLITRLIQFDASTGLGLSEISPAYFVSTGISFRNP